MRKPTPVVLAVMLLTGGCETVDTSWIGPAAAVQIGTTMLIGRGPFEAAYSVLTGRDCSLANWAAEKRFCAQQEVVTRPRYCTRSLGVVDCWTVVDPFGPQQGVADTPARPPMQDRTWVSLRPDPPAGITETPRRPTE
jgi:hypothetical protein